MTTQGEELIERCKQHVMETLRTLPERAPNGPGLRNKDIETACGFALGLPRQDGLDIWSQLMLLLQDKRITFTTHGKRRGIRYFRLLQGLPSWAAAPVSK